MNNRFAFLPMEISNDLLDDPVALRARLAEDGYLYFRQVLDPQAVLRVRQDVLDALAGLGWVEPGIPRTGRCTIAPLHEADEEFIAGYQAVQRLQSFHELAHHPSLMRVMHAAKGDTAFPHPLKIARINFPDNYEISTPPHQDFPNNQGSPDLLASWVPISDMGEEMGGLAILRGSHKFGPMELAGHMGAGSRCAVVPLEVQEACRWVTTEFNMGDVLLFPALTVHAALHNASEFFVRLSVDFRYQLEGERLTEGCLEPHFQRLSWEDVYAGWRSDELQYYWRDLDYEVVPFEELRIDGGRDDMDMDRRDFGDIFRYLVKRDARTARRLERLGIKGFVPRSERQGLLAGASESDDDR